DLDIISSSFYYYAGTVTYYLNSGSASNPVFGTGVSGIGGMASVPYNYLMSPTVADLDHDGDYDILATLYSYSYYSNRVLYYENTGSAAVASFGTPLLDPFGMSGKIPYFAIPHLVDLDVDGDFDLVAGQFNGYE